jgi:hypothetical protein
MGLALSSFLPVLFPILGPGFLGGFHRFAFAHGRLGWHRRGRSQHITHNDAREERTSTIQGPKEALLHNLRAQPLTHWRPPRPQVPSSPCWCPTYLILLWIALLECDLSFAGTDQAHDANAILLGGRRDVVVTSLPVETSYLSTTAHLASATPP